ncbi:hypothetical protein RJT34_02867 [Clitoria ternatea]|uniref:Uncharacterized protein n=1 Tax=Clitoria ternatea TaxID=43366 RepID=A0AAN9Q4C9_CLITE
MFAELCQQNALTLPKRLANRFNGSIIVVNGEIVDLSDPKDEEEAVVEDVPGAKAGAESTVVDGSMLTTVPQQPAVDTAGETLPDGVEGEGMPQGEILGAAADS